MFEYFGLERCALSLLTDICKNDMVKERIGGLDHVGSDNWKKNPSISHAESESGRDTENMPGASRNNY